MVTQIKASITAGIRPTSLVLHRQPRDDWTALDFKLLEAYQMLQDETCPRCGQPVWLCRSDSNNVAFKVQSDTCFAEKAMKAFEDGRKDKKEQKASIKEKRDWGKFWYTVAFVPPTADGDLPTRFEYLTSLQKAK